jgi:hypothetical protein
MRDSFSTLAASAVAKSDTLDANAATIASLSNTIAELTATNKKLVAALAAAKQGGRNVNPPPGFAADANMTGHSLNALGDLCPTKKFCPNGRWQFVTKQFCKTYNNMVNHVPADCSELPGNEKKSKRRWPSTGPRSGSSAPRRVVLQLQRLWRNEGAHQQGRRSQ